MLLFVPYNNLVQNYLAEILVYGELNPAVPQNSDFINPNEALTQFLNIFDYEYQYYWKTCLH